jgi:hypothetical protein
MGALAGQQSSIVVHEPLPNNHAAVDWSGLFGLKA